MAQPVWITPAGSLGTIPEGVFFQVPLLAEEPDLGETIYYSVIAGTLPAGVQCEQTGLIAGIPKAVANIQGVPSEVSNDVVSKFAVRAYTTRVVNGVTVINRLADRTFTLTVTGQDAPEFITPAGNIATYYDGSQVNDLQIEYTDTDPADLVTVRLVAGKLPPGLSISTTGKISGFIQPESEISATQGFSRDGQGFSQYSFDFGTRSVNVTYEFVLEVTDGKANNLRTFTITVYSRDSLTADTTDFTADDTFITADVTPVRPPILLTPEGSIGTTRSDNFFAFKFDGIDLDGDRFAYELVYDIGDSAGIPGLTLDPESGWLYGYIPNLGLTELSYDFKVRLYKVVDPAVFSQDYQFSLTVIGFIDTDITWITASDLGTIDNGAVSNLYVSAINAQGIPLSFRLRSGSNSSLPQGLKLLPSGDIVGRVSFDTFALDGGTTTFDVNSRDRTITSPTTFDLKFDFVVEAYAAAGGGNISVFKTFTITINRAFNEPYENLYIQAMPPENDRVLIESLLQDQSIIPVDLIYRNDDPNFGVSQHVIYWHAYGLTSSTYADYVSSLYQNHYWKNLILGNIETAQALDSNGNVLYEVVYSRVIDDLVNSAGKSVNKDVVIPYPINAGDSTEIDVVYPNSLINMRDQVIDTIGQVSNVLPKWMTSKQTTGQVLGFTPAWVICYTKPGKSKQIAYNINNYFENIPGQQLNLIDFKVDRYELDRLLSIHWNPTTDEWIPTPPEATTFDLQAHYQLPEPNDSSFIFDGGTDYAVGDQILILGSDIGGDDGVNDVVVTVEQVNGSGTIEVARATGIAPLLSVGNIYTNISGNNITGEGVGATWDLEVVGEDPTVFDGNSLKFIAPVDMYNNTTDFDKYLVFPKRNILE